MAPQREWFDKDYYKTLGVAKTASSKEITKAYRSLAREFHPDANPGDVKAEERFKEISGAYDVLGDEAKRAEYDEVRRLGPMGGMGGFGGGRGSTGGSPFDMGDVGDLGDLLGGLFGRGRQRPGQGGPRSTAPQRGDDLEASLHLSFHDAVTGVTTVVNLISDAPCTGCRGTGAAPGTAPQPCDACNGQGVRAEDQGFFSFSSPCTACRGNGSIITTPCGTCRGAGTERRPREVKVRIPAGVDDGQTIRLKGRGGPGRQGGMAGDLHVRVTVGTDPVFGRKGHHLTVTVPVTFAEAALGAELVVPTLDGAPVKLRLAPGTPSGRTLRVRGRGIPLAKGAGDLRVTVEIVVPQAPGADELAAIEQLALVTSGSDLRRHLVASETSDAGAG